MALLQSIEGFNITTYVDFDGQAILCFSSSESVDISKHFLTLSYDSTVPQTV
jgi:hypothetical protein